MYISVKEQMAAARDAVAQAWSMLEDGDARRRAAQIRKEAIEELRRAIDILNEPTGHQPDEKK